MEKIKGWVFLVFQLSCVVFAHIATFAEPAIYCQDKEIVVSDTSLPKIVNLSGRKVPSGAGLEWNTAGLGDVKEISVQSGLNGKTFSTVYTFKAPAKMYTDEWPRDKTSGYYRLQVAWTDGSYAFSNVVFISSISTPSSITLLTNPVADLAKLKIVNSCNQAFMAEWRNSQGTVIETQAFNVSTGNNRVELSVPASMVPGTYYLRVVSDDKKQRQLFRVMKQ